MTRFLASIKNKAEAETAYFSGADIIDLKNPAEGALGAASLDTVLSVSRTLKNRATVSATIGDLPPDPEVVSQAIEKLIKCKVDIIKVGFFPGNQHGLANSLGKQASKHKLVAVLFAEQKPDSRLLKTLSENSFYGVILDTANKNDQGLLKHLSLEALKDYIQLSHQLQLQCGLAGQLGQEDIPELLKLNPDYLGFRSALCSGKRTGELSLQAIQNIRRVIPLDNQSTANRHSTYRDIGKRHGQEVIPG